MKGKKSSVVTYTEDIICDVCKKSCKASEDSCYEYSMWEAQWGFCSKRDGIFWSAYICEPCSEKLKEWIESQGGQVFVAETE